MPSCFLEIAEHLYARETMQRIPGWEGQILAPVVCSGVCINPEISASIALPSSSPTAQASGGCGVMVLQAGLYAVSS